MMLTRIYLTTDAPDSWKFCELSDKMGWELKTAFGAVGLLWCRVGRSREDGVLRNWSASHIARMCDVRQEDAAKFVKALEDCKLIGRDGENYVVHDWLDEQGPILEMRRRWREGQAKIRAMKDGKPKTTGDEPFTDEGDSGGAVSHIMQVCRQCKVPDGEAMTRKFVTSWVQRFGAQIVEKAVMDHPGYTVFEIQKILTTDKNPNGSAWDSIKEGKK